MADSINNLNPGQQLSQEQKAKLAADNVAASIEAHRLAAEQRRRDLDGIGRQHSEQFLAQSIREKLEKGEVEEGKIHMKND